jgi:hypothetical protein
LHGRAAIYYTVWMYSIIKQLRRAGVRRSLREIQSDPGLHGHLTVVSVAGMRLLNVHAAGDQSHQRPLCAFLYEPVLVSMHGARMLFVGYERAGNQNDPLAQTHMQEWSVEVIERQ